MDNTHTKAFEKPIKWTIRFLIFALIADLIHIALIAARHGGLYLLSHTSVFIPIFILLFLLSITRKINKWTFVLILFCSYILINISINEIFYGIAFIYAAFKEKIGSGSVFQHEMIIIVRDVMLHLLNIPFALISLFLKLAIPFIIIFNITVRKYIGQISDTEAEGVARPNIFRTILKSKLAIISILILLWLNSYDLIYSLGTILYHDQTVNVLLSRSIYKPFIDFLLGIALLISVSRRSGWIIPIAFVFFIPAFFEDLSFQLKKFYSSLETILGPQTRGIDTLRMLFEFFRFQIFFQLIGFLSIYKQKSRYNYDDLKRYIVDLSDYMDEKFRGLADSLKNSAMIKILESFGKLALLLAVITWILSIPEIRETEESNLWKMVSSTKGELQKKALKKLRTKFNRSFYGLDLSNSFLYRYDLSNMDLRSSYFTKSHLYETNLSYSKLSKADLSNAIFEKSILHNTILDKADLSKAFISESHLSDAKLYFANLRGTIFYKSDLTNAKLTKAKIDENTSFQLSRLDNANFRHAEGLTLLMINYAESWNKETLFPDYILKIVEEQKLFRNVKVINYYSIKDSVSEAFEGSKFVITENMYNETQKLVYQSAIDHLRFGLNLFSDCLEKNQSSDKHALISQCQKKLDSINEYPEKAYDVWGNEIKILQFYYLNRNHKKQPFVIAMSLGPNENRDITDNDISKILSVYRNKIFIKEKEFEAIFDSVFRPYNIVPSDKTKDEFKTQRTKELWEKVDIFSVVSVDQEEWTFIYDYFLKKS
jgi:hypothetical protein